MKSLPTIKKTKEKRREKGKDKEKAGISIVISFLFLYLSIFESSSIFDKRLSTMLLWVKDWEERSKGKVIIESINVYESKEEWTSFKRRVNSMIAIPGLCIILLSCFSFFVLRPGTRIAIKRRIEAFQRPYNNKSLSSSGLSSDGRW